MRSLLVIALLTLFASRCGDELPVQGGKQFRVAQDSGWVASMRQGDTITVSVRVTGPAGRIVTGVPVAWQSSDESVLEISPVALPVGASHEDSLEASLHARLIAHTHGNATVSITIEQAGFDTATVTPAPTVQVFERWIALSVGGDHSCAISIDHELMCWGAGDGSDLRGLGIGNGVGTGSDIPVPVQGALRFTTVSAGRWHTCGVTMPDKLVYCWGRDHKGQLGIGSLVDAYYPVPTALGNQAATVSAGEDATCANIAGVPFQHGGPTQTYCWGDTLELGRTGVGSGCGGGCSPAPTDPADANYGGDVRFDEVSVGADHVCAIYAPLYVFCWGSNSRGQLGPNTTASEERRPVAVGGMFGPVAVVAGGSQSCAILSDHSLACWGDNRQGQLGNPAAHDSSSLPVAVPGLTDVIAVSTAGGFTYALDGSSNTTAHTCAITADGRAYCWGANTTGALGIGSSGGIQRSPVPVAEPSDGPVRYVAISVGVGGRTEWDGGGVIAHSCALTSTGVIYCWGGNSFGQVAVPGGDSTILIPTRIAEPK